MLKKILRYTLPLIIVLVLIAFLWRGLSLHPRELPSALIGKVAAPFTLSNLLHPQQQVSEKIFKGHLTLLNVWASWCETCVEEQAFLMTLKARYPKWQFIGLDFQDKPKDAVKWLKMHGNPYTLVLSDTAGHMGVDYGVYGTPESFLIDEQGVILAKVTGVLNEEKWTQLKEFYA